MELKTTQTPVQSKKAYSVPKLVLHGDIAEITLDLFGEHPWKCRRRKPDQTS